MRVFLLEPPEALVQQIDAEEDMELAGVASTGAEALDALPAARADIFVMDAHLPDRNGIDLCRQARSRFPNMRVMLLTPYENDDAVSGAVFAGASGCMLRDAPGTELVEAIRDIWRGDTVIDLSLVKQARAEPLVSDPHVPTETLEEASVVEARAARARGEVFGGEDWTPVGPPPGRRQRWRVPYVLAALAGIVAVALLFTNNTGSKTTHRAARRISAQPKVPTTETTVPPETTTTSSSTESTELSTAAGSGSSGRSQSNTASEPRLTFSYAWADCEGSHLQVAGSVQNNASSPFSVSFAVTVISASGRAQGTGTASLSRIGSGERRSFTATGSCSGPLSSGISPSTHIDSVTPA